MLFDQTFRGMWHEGSIKAVYIPPDVWLAIVDAVRLRELEDHRKRNMDTKYLPQWADHVVLNSGDLLSLSSVCRHFRQALFQIALERLRVVPRKTKNKHRKTRMLFNTARMLEILMEPEGAWERDLVQEFAFGVPGYELKHLRRAPKIFLWGDVLLSLKNVRRVHLTDVLVDVGELLKLTKLRHLKIERSTLVNIPADRSPGLVYPSLQSLQILDTVCASSVDDDHPETISSSSVEDDGPDTMSSSSAEDDGPDTHNVTHNVLVSPALTHLVVDWQTFKLIPWAACTGLRELVLTTNEATLRPGSEKVVAALEHCVSLQGLYLYGVSVQDKHAVRLQKLKHLQTIACDVEVVEHLLPGRPVEHLGLPRTDTRWRSYGWQGHDWRMILETIGKSTSPIKTLDAIDFRECNPQYSLQVLEQLVETFGALEELGLVMPDEQGIMAAIPIVAQLEALQTIGLISAKGLPLDPQDWFPWREARLRDLVALSKSKQLREVDLGDGHVWRWVELKTWVYCGPNVDAPKFIYLQ